MPALYNHLGNVIRTKVDAGTTVTLISATCDELGCRLTGMNAVGETRSFEYDSQGRLTAVELPAPVVGAASPRYEYAYVTDGRRTLIRDPPGRKGIKRCSKRCHSNTSKPFTPQRDVIELRGTKQATNSKESTMQLQLPNTKTGVHRYWPTPSRPYQIWRPIFYAALERGLSVLATNSMRRATKVVQV